jgi:hypothetical protein
MKYIKEYELQENLRFKGHNLDSHKINNNQVFAGPDGIMIDEIFITWKEIESLHNKYEPKEIKIK